MRGFPAVILLLGVLVSSGLALKCYICDSLDNPGECGHGKIAEEYLKDCNDPSIQEDRVAGAKYDVCRKIVTTIEFDVNKHTATERIRRRCGYLESEYNEKCYYRGGYGGKQRVCSCKEEGCNSAHSLTTPVTFIALSVAASMFKYLL